MEGAAGDHQQNNGIASKPPSASPDSGVAGIKENGTQNHVSSPNHLKVNHSSSKSGDKHNSSLHKSSSDKHHRSSSSDPSKHKSSSSHGDKHRSSSSHGDKHKSSSSSSSKHHSSSHSSSKDSSKSKHSSSKDSSKHKHRDGHSSSSSSKHKEGHSSSSSSKERSKDGHHSSSKHKDGSSSSKHRDGEHKSKEHRHSSDKHKDKHREKNRESSSSRPKEEGKSSSEVKVKTAEHGSKSPEPKVKSPDRGMKSPERSVKSPDIKIKEEPMSPSKVKQEVKQEKTPEVTVKQEVRDDSEDDMPLSARMPQPAKVKAEKRRADSDDDDEPLSARLDKAKKQKKVKTEKETVKRKMSEPDSPQKKKKKKKDEVAVKSPKKKAKDEQEDKKWKWWEEDKKDDGVKWNYLEHKGPVFAPAYEPLPDDVRFYYNGKEMKLSEEAEEVAGFYSRMLEHDYTTKDIFNDNFFKDWRKVMTSKEREMITDLKKCNFKELFEFYKQQSEDRKNRTKEQKQALKKENEAIVEEYGFCVIDGHRQKIGNFKIEPPGLFRGRGEHPKQGMLKTRTQPEDVTINCSRDAPVPKAPDGHKWKEVRHDNTVTWLASWCENIQGSNKYVMLNAASKLKGEKDWQKYEMARKLHKCVDKIRATYHEDWKSKEMRVRQRAVALYFIDKLALRAGNEKEEGETADTVGCCSLRVEHLRLHEKMDNLDWVVEFDFLGKDSIRYYNKVAIEKRVFKNLQLFMENKNEGDDLFDRLNTTILNKHLQNLMEGLTAKVFRTYNASKTLQDQLELLTTEDDSVPAKLLSYNRANRAVAVLCNHQRAVPKNFDKQMENLQKKIDDKKAQLKEAKRSVKEAKADVKAVNTDKNRNAYEKKRKAVERIQLALNKLEVQATDKDENKEIALGTSKLNYLDPRISVAWCKKYEVPIEKIYNKTQREKFAWAIDMADEDYEF